MWLFRALWTREMADSALRTRCPHSQISEPQMSLDVSREVEKNWRCINAMNSNEGRDQLACVSLKSVEQL